jgi:hypothetical protein
LIKVLLGLVITFSLFWVLFRYIEIEQLGRLLASMRWSWCLAGLGFWVALYCARSVRFVQLAPRTPYLTMLSIAAVHNFLLRLLPMRTGDLSYGFLVRRAGTAGLGESLLGLLLLRVLDGTTVMVLFVVSLVLDRGVYVQDRTRGLLWAGAGVLLCLALVASLGRLLRLGLGLARGLARGLGLERRAGVQRLLDRVAESVERFGTLRRVTVLQLGLTSLGVWLLTYGGFFAIMRAFSTPVGYARIVLACTAGVVVSFLPVGGIGTFGTMDMGMAFGLILVGVERSQAVASGIGLSIVTFGYAAVLGLLGWTGLVLRAPARPGGPRQ